MSIAARSEKRRPFQQARLNQILFRYFKFTAVTRIRLLTTHHPCRKHLDYSHCKSYLTSNYWSSALESIRTSSIRTHITVDSQPYSSPFKHYRVKIIQLTNNNGILHVTASGNICACVKLLVDGIFLMAKSCPEALSREIFWYTSVWPL